MTGGITTNIGNRALNNVSNSANSQDKMCMDRFIACRAGVNLQAKFEAASMMAKDSSAFDQVPADNEEEKNANNGNSTRHGRGFSNIFEGITDKNEMSTSNSIKYDHLL